MSKLTKGIISFLVISCMILTALPAFAEDAEPDEVAEVAAEAEPLEGFALASVDFEDGEVPFNADNNIEELVVEDGVLFGTSIGGDPYMSYAPGLSLAADMVDYIFIAMAADSTSTAFQLFFTTDTIGWSEDASFKYDFADAEVDENGFFVIALNTADCAAWAGTITGMRLDPLAGEGVFAVDEIILWSTTTTILKIDWADYEVAPFDASGVVPQLFVEDGYLYGQTKGDPAGRIDPYLNFNGEFSLNADYVGAIHFKVKNFSSSTAFQFFFTTETIGWSEDASIKFDLNDYYRDAYGWYYVELDTSACAEWKGTITNFRLDPAEANGVFVFCSINFDTVGYTPADLAEEIPEEELIVLTKNDIALQFDALHYIFTYYDGINGLPFVNVNFG